MKLMACAVAGMTMLAGAAQAGEWRAVVIDEEVGMLLDTSTIRNLPYSQKKVAWTATLFPVTEDDGGDYYKVQTEYDCAAMTSAQLSLFAYGVEDKVIGSSTSKKAPQPVIPDTRGYDMYRAVCDGIDTPVSDNVRNALKLYRDAIVEEN